MFELKPCPLCGHGRLFKVHILSRRLPWWYFIECQSCHACGKTKLFMFRAIRSWNKRAGMNDG